MERVNRILRNPVYREALQKNQEAEKERRYCHHDMAHFLDVARIAMLLAAKEQIVAAKEQLLPISEEKELPAFEDRPLPISEEKELRAFEDGSLPISEEKELHAFEDLVYAAALVHDIGRYRQYEDGTPHEEASAALAADILLDSGFDEKETHVIIDAVRSHRDAGIAEEKSLRGLLYRADKLSRACFACPAQGDCNWSAEKKNMRLVL